MTDVKSTGILGNNLRAFTIHVVNVTFSFLLLLAVIVVTMVFTADIQDIIVQVETETAILDVLGNLVYALALSTYVISGYLFLKPLAKRNLLSVSFPALCFFALALLYYVLYYVFSLMSGWYFDVINPLTWINFHAIEGTMFVFFNEPNRSAQQYFFGMLIAAPIPSLLMYLGLRLKIWRRSVSSNGRTLPREEADKVAQYD